MKIAFLLNSLQTGGAEIHTVDLASALQKQGHECLLFPLLPSAQISDRGLDCRTVNGNGLSDIAALRRLSGLLKDTAPNLVVAVNERPMMYAHLTRLIGAPTIPTAVIYHTTKLPRGKQRFLHRLAAPMFARSDALVYVSENQRRYWTNEGLTARSVNTIHNGIDMSRFSPSAVNRYRRQSRAKLGYTADDYVIGLSAAFRPEKNHLQALDAIAALRAAGVSAKLLLIGDGDTLPIVRRYAEDLGIIETVIFAGRQTDVVPWLTAIDVGLLTSTAIETFSLAALEIMALGIPCILSDTGGASEMIDEGQTGRLFPVGDTSVLVARLTELAVTPVRHAMGQAAAKKVGEKFTHGRMVKSYDKLLRSIVVQ